MIPNERDDEDETGGSDRPELEENETADHGSAAEKPENDSEEASNASVRGDSSNPSEDEDQTHPDRDTDESVTDESTIPDENQRESEQAESSGTGGWDTDTDSVDFEVELSSLKAALEESNERIDKLETRLDDYERRNDREHEELRKYAVEDLARELLNVKDMLGDAIRLEDFEADTERRLEMVDQQFENVLTSGRIELIEPDERDPYDDMYHRMEEKVQTEDYEPNQVVRVIEVGYRASDRVIRPARVEVAAPQED